MATWFFYLSLMILFYTFAGYPLLLFVLSRFKAKPINRGQTEPKVAIIIPVHNAEHTIVEKIENCLQFDYPAEKTQIVVVSDGSTDRTAEIIKEYARDRVLFLDPGFRGGKVTAQNYAVQCCEADVFVFTDVSITTNPDCIRSIVENFYDDSVGAVSCRDALIGKDGKPEGEGIYINYDMLVRRFTSAVGSLIGVTGGFYAVRREIAKGGWNPAFPPDFYVALRSIKRGLRVVEDSRVMAYYKVAAKGTDEFPRKVRTINRGMTAIFSRGNRCLLNPWKFGFISLEIISHKLLRWLAPFFFIQFFAASLVLSGHSVAMLFVAMIQAVAYLMGVVSFLVGGAMSDSRLLKIPTYFVMANFAIISAWVEVAMRKKYVMWEPTKR